jgi:hypothetical protein
MLRTANLHPARRGLSLRFDGGLSPDAGSQLPGTLASPRADSHLLAEPSFAGHNT